MNKLLSLTLLLSAVFFLGFKNIEPSALLGTKWNVDIIIDGDKELRSPLPLLSTQPIDPPFIEFKTKGKINGFSASNLFNTRFEAKKDGSVKIGQVGSTRMAVRYPEYERAFLKALSETSNFAIKDDVLAFKSAEGKTLLLANKAKDAKKEPKQSLSLSGTKWMPVYIEEGKPFSAVDERMPFIEFSSKDKINGFAGDNIFNGNYTLGKNGEFKIGDNLAITMMMGINGEYEYAFLQALRKVVKVEVKDENMLCLFDKKGNLLMHLKPCAWIKD